MTNYHDENQDPIPDDRDEELAEAEQSPYLFIYGALRQELNHPLRHLVLSQCDYVGTAFMRGNLYDLGGYPGLRLCEEDPDAELCEYVNGEIYSMRNPKHVLDLLDHYKGMHDDDIKGHEYRRELHQLIPQEDTEELEITAWVYVYDADLPETAQHVTTGDFVMYQQELALKPTAK